MKGGNRMKRTLIFAIALLPFFAQGEELSRQEALRECLARKGFTLDEHKEAQKLFGHSIPNERRAQAIVQGAICEADIPRQAKKEQPTTIRLLGPVRVCATEKGISPEELEAETLADKTQAILAVCRGQLSMTPRFIEVASADLRTCLGQQILRLDDGTSPASDIASAVSLSCEEQFEKLMQHLEFKDTGHWRTRDTDVGIRREAVYRMALPLVLEVRAARRTPPAKQEKPAKRRLES
jgi:hypothetical protein